MVLVMSFPGIGNTFKAETKTEVGLILRSA